MGTSGVTVWRAAAGAAACALLIAANAGAQEQGALDGTQFAVIFSVTGSGAGENDTLSFARGQLLSAAWRRMGFAPAPYQAERSREGWTFSAEARSARNGELSWRGMVFSDQTISGSLVWSRRGREPVNYIFVGRRR